MPDREKVIKGLEWCMNEKHDCYREKGCPYENEGEDIGCKYALHRDALALLKAQEPVVMAGAELTDTELIEKIRKAPFVLKPAVDAVPVVHGRWIKPVPGDGEAYCSNCKHDALPCGYYLNPALMKYYETAYCPNCGAKMDGERRNEDATD